MEYVEAVERYEEDVRQRALDNYKRIVQYVNSLSLDELRIVLIKQLTNHGEDDDYEDYEDEESEEIDFNEDDCDEDNCDEDNCDEDNCDEDNCDEDDCDE